MRRLPHAVLACATGLLLLMGILLVAAEDRIRIAAFSEATGSKLPSPWRVVGLPGSSKPFTRFDLVPLDGQTVLRVLADHSYANLVHDLGEKLPAATLCYVWDHTLPVGTLIDNAFTSRIRMIVVDSGTKALGQWVSHQQDVTADFRRAFGREFPTLPPLEGVAVGADADNTQSRSLSYIADLVLQP